MWLIDGKISGILPFRLRLPDGRTRTSLYELDETQLAELGIYPCDEIKPPLEWTQHHGTPVIEVADGRATATYPVLDYSPVEISEMLSAAKEQKKAEIAAARYEAEIAGVTINNTFIKTDRESRSLLTGACLQAVIDPEYSLNWKMADGTWIKLSAEDIKAVGTTVRVYTQAQFDEEERLCGLIDNATTAEDLEVITWTSA